MSILSLLSLKNHTRPVMKGVPRRKGVLDSKLLIQLYLHNEDMKNVFQITWTFLELILGRQLARSTAGVCGEQIPGEM